MTHEKNNASLASFMINARNTDPVKKSESTLNFDAIAGCRRRTVRPCGHVN